MSFISGVFAITATHKSVVISVLVLSIFAVIIAAVGAGVDIVAALVFASEVSCLSSGGTYSGVTSATNKNDLVLCTIIFSPSVYDCTCLGSNLNTCYGYNGHSNCADILNIYPGLLKASGGIVAALAVINFILVVLASASACSCCPAASPAASDSAPKSPEVVQVADVKVVA
jgi:hypothetical protein